jgi:hypothetical protein
MKRYIYIALILLGYAGTVSAKENVGEHRYSGPEQGNQVFSGCAASKSRKDLDINNVRCPVWINGDMWWDLSGTALYEVPVGSGKHSLFAGAIWIGGKEAGSQNLKVAAQTYRQSGSDFWPGPIDKVTTDITPDQCIKYDQHWKITLAEVKDFHRNFQGTDPDLNYPIPDVIKTWPANGAPEFNQEAILAPFYDRLGDGVYDYNDGDYPRYNVDGNLDPCDKSLLLGDQTIWWVFNDVGNIHGETDSQYPVKVEIQAQAFGFNTNDEINNMTFYRYKITNRATTDLNETYFGAWVDPDLGNYLDDYVGCDVQRGLGYCYNGDADDDGAIGYGTNPPAVGVDFFEGPLADSLDLIDNDLDGDTDEVGEQIIMSKFVYYNNDNSNFGNPNNAQQYYNYLKGIWKDGSGLQFGGNGYNSGGVPCNYMFPGDSDPNGIGTGGVYQGYDWSETQPTGPNSSPNEPSDRRFLQSAGPFTLKPGAINYITTGVVWARTSSGGPLASVKLLKLADVKAQNLFEACFKVVDGPHSPSVSVRELDKELILSLTNPDVSNNAREDYREKDINIPGDQTAIYRFEGYKIYQVIDPSVSVGDLLNADKARLVFQCDLKNGVSQIVNKVLDGNLNAFVPTEMVQGADKGLVHTVRIKTDAFASGDPSLVNHKTYYFMAIAYGFDATADVLDPYVLPPSGIPGIYGQPYIQSRQNAYGLKVDIATGIPHISTPEASGVVLGAGYGSGPELTRYTGTGNGYDPNAGRSTLDIRQDQIDNLLLSGGSRMDHPIYVGGRGPVDVRIYDPFAISGGDFELWTNDTISNVEFTGDVADGSYDITNVSSLNNLRVGAFLSAANDHFPIDAQIVAINGNTITMSDSVSTGSGNPVGLTINAGSRWYLKNVQSGQTVRSLKGLDAPYDQLFPDYGFYVSMSQVKNTGEAPVDGNGFAEATITYADPNKPWLTGVPDVNTFLPLDWIIAGKDVTGDYLNGQDPLDPSENFAKSLGGTWAPFRLTNTNTDQEHLAPAPSIALYSSPSAVKYDDLSLINSIDIVITNDKSKWSRCVVFEEGTNPLETEGGQFHCLLRKHPSMNLDGSYSSTEEGRSYFPGYAINVETGERLNIAFGEDSRFPNANGNDMKWNPTTTMFTTDGSGNSVVLAGGRHFIYVFGNKINSTDQTLSAAQSLAQAVTLPDDTSYYGGAYDGCDHIYYQLSTLPNITATINKKRVKKVWKDCMWVGTTMTNLGQQALSNDVKIRLRVNKPYRQYDTGVQNSPNNNMPFYKFNTDNLKPQVGQTEVAKNALSLINVVPNPYYAYSQYEVNQLDNRVKIVNLPPTCVVSIYSPNGTLIRQLKRSVGSNNTDGSNYPDKNFESSLDWDLKNSKGVPIASGVYIIHVAAEGIGERTIKWFGVLRPIDLDTF